MYRCFKYNKMEEKQICRLCFIVIGSKLDEINDIIGDMLEVLLLDMDWSIIKNRFVCKTCTAIIKRLFYFKSVCVHTEKFITSFAVDTEQAKLELENIGYNKEGTEMAVDENFRCRFCLNRMRSNLFSIEILMEDTLYKKMLPEFIPEIDFSIVNIPIICAPCKENLECYFMFVRKVLDTENKIHVSYQSIDANQIESADILHFQFNETFTHPNNGKVTISEEPEKECSFELMKTEEIKEIKDEEVLLKEDPCGSLSEIVSDEDTTIYKSDHRNEINKVKHKSILDAYTAKYKHNSAHKDTLEIAKYKCGMCPFATKYKSHLKQHMLLIHDVVQMYKCKLCTYVTQYKRSLDKHMFTHRNDSGMYKCSHCSYETKLRNRIKNHAIIHQDVSEVQIYECELCPYVTRHKGCLKQHLLIHKDPSEVKMYKCPLCPYESKWKGELTRHSITHKDVSEVQIYECELCPYTTRYKRNVKQHLLIHKNPSEVKMYKCPLCPYESRRNSQLTSHSIKHKDASELEMYGCSLCDCQYKRKRDLKYHMLRHRYCSELKMYKCPDCNFQTKYVNNLSKHMFTHRGDGGSEIAI